MPLFLFLEALSLSNIRLYAPLFRSRSLCKEIADPLTQCVIVNEWNLIISENVVWTSTLNGRYTVTVVRTRPYRGDLSIAKAWGLRMER